MRIWDVNPGYLNRQSLLGEHRELHGVVSIIKNKKKGYSRHPETLRWVGYGWALSQRHKLLVAEMTLRGYVDKSPVLLRSNPGAWPEGYIDSPAEQVVILRQKYQALEPGRIPLPKNEQQFWAHHKYSVMARDIAAYEDIGQRMASRSGKKPFSNIAAELSVLLRTAPNPRLITNALQHMWGYVSKYSSISGAELGSLSNRLLLHKIQTLSLQNKVEYLSESTALSELNAWKI